MYCLSVPNRVYIGLDVQRYVIIIFSSKMRIEALQPQDFLMDEIPFTLLDSVMMRVSAAATTA
jgi:hypothetical protein